MEQTNSSQEPNMRLNFKQSAKGQFQTEWTVRADCIAELEARNNQVKELALAQLKKLNLL